MSINRDFKKMMLQRKVEKRSSSGAPVETWEDVGKISVAIYKNSDMISVDSAKYNNSTHSGLTHCKEIKEGVNRLVCDGSIYQITGCNTVPRLTNLLLKEIDTNA